LCPRDHRLALLIADSVLSVPRQSSDDHDALFLVEQLVLSSSSKTKTTSTSNQDFSFSCAEKMIKKETASSTGFTLFDSIMSQ
jgi:hypothetical protein